MENFKAEKELKDMFKMRTLTQWLVIFTVVGGEQKKTQVVGDSAQDAVDHIRRTEDVEIIDCVARIDNNWE